MKQRLDGAFDSCYNLTPTEVVSPSFFIFHKKEGRRPYKSITQAKCYTLRITLHRDTTQMYSENFNYIKANRSSSSSSSSVTVGEKTV
ncbi:hypothetical protein GQX74_008671 [Glossina fuscipes]|nr:hypothetical protein GQX74_008671 [Glossina fuscipes]